MRTTNWQFLALVLSMGMTVCGNADLSIRKLPGDSSVVSAGSDATNTAPAELPANNSQTNDSNFKIECNTDKSECVYKKMQLYKQTDERIPSSIRLTNSGNNLCAPTSLTMVVDTLLAYPNIKVKSNGLFNNKFKDREVYQEQIPNMVDLMQAGMASDNIAINGSNAGHFDNFLSSYTEIEGAEAVALSTTRTDAIFPGSQFKFKKTNFSYETIKGLLDQKNILVVSVCLGCSKKCSTEVGKCSFAGSGHAIAIRGYNDKEKKILLNDPNGMQTSFSVEKIDLGQDQSKWIFDINSTYSLGQTKNIATGEVLYNVIMEMHGYKLP